MPAPAIYLDECVDQRLAQFLRAQGFDVITVQEAGTASDEDEDQLLYASDQGRVLLSHNQLDFRRLHAAFERDGRAHQGIMLVPQTVPLSRLEIRVRLLLDWAASFPDCSSKLFTWHELQQQLIHDYRLPGWDEAAVREALGWS
jgi:predicted nuclease of predicted toxin-antitoxin system